jgi:gamma-glutamyl phosphate reductase
VEFAGGNSDFGAEQLTTFKYRVHGTGQTRP